jgi:hypothetical protein
MGTTVTSMAEKRKSSRIVPIGSNEDIVILGIGGDQHLAKILDLSDGGVCVYMVAPDAPIKTEDTLSIGHLPQRIRLRTSTSGSAAKPAS